MPFDAMLPEIDLTELRPGKEGLRQLAYLLRHPEKWLPGHVWNFEEILAHTQCGTVGCAIGIADLQWGKTAVDHEWYGPWDEAEDIFDGGNVYDCPASAVTPPMVADAIDHFLATGRVPVAGAAL